MYNCDKNDDSITINDNSTAIDEIIPDEVIYSYDESTDGDLSDSSTSPTSITFELGDNIIVASQTSDGPDYFTFSIPEGYALSQLVVDDFDVNDPGFIGIANSTVINGATAADLLGGLVYGATNIDEDILPEIGTLNGATGFTGVLPSGDYTIWLNQTGSASTATLNFVVTML